MPTNMHAHTYHLQRGQTREKESPHPRHACEKALPVDKRAFAFEGVGLKIELRTLGYGL